MTTKHNPKIIVFLTKSHQLTGSSLLPKQLHRIILFFSRLNKRKTENARKRKKVAMDIIKIFSGKVRRNIAKANSIAITLNARVKVNEYGMSIEETRVSRNCFMSLSFPIAPIKSIIVTIYLDNSAI